MDIRTMMIMMLATGVVLGLSVSELYRALRDMRRELAVRKLARGLVAEADMLNHWSCPQ